MSTRTLIRGGCVLTLGARTPNWAEADVLIDGATIAEVGRGLRARDAEVVEAADTIVMPGFVDSHRHVWRSLLRNVGAGGDGTVSALGTYGLHHQPDDVYAATLIGLLGAVEAGITTVVDWSDIQLDGRYTDAVIQAHADAGLRTVLLPTPPRWADGAPGEPSPDVGDDRTVGPTTTVAHGSDEPTRAGLDALLRGWTAARGAGRRIHAHAGSSPAERGVVADLHGRGLLGADVTLVHCSHLDDGDLDAVASSGTAVALTPACEMAEGMAPPMQQLLDRGIRPGLGVDDERLSPGDLFAQMRTAMSVQHATLFDRKLAGKGGLPNLLNTRDVIRYSTIDGARAAGVGDVTGSLEPGKQADVVVLRGDRPNISPINDPIGAVVWGMDTSNVDWVFVAGRPLLHDGVLEADVARARKLATEAQHRVTVSAGVAVAAAERSRA